jgi:signal transduction histidine kinase
VETLGGTIHVVSIMDQGTTFTVSLKRFESS